MGAPVITVYVRHSADCRYKGDEFCRRCSCRKHFRWSQSGTQHRRRAGTRSWEEAEEIKRQLQDQLAGRTPEVRPEDTTRTIQDALDVFIQDKQVQGITPGVVSRYKNELSRLRSYCESVAVYTVQGITRELLTGYAATWEKTYASSNTRAGVRDRLRSFLRYCYEAKWLERIPLTPRVIADEPPTLPLSASEYTRLLKTIDVTRPLRGDAKGVTRLLGTETKQRLRALIQLMRWSGLAIQDAVKLRRSEIVFDRVKGVYRVVTSRQKTGVDVSVPIPKEVAKEILSASPASDEHIFWTGKSTGRTAPSMWGSRYIRSVFETAGLRSGHMVSHRLRDTFAVDLLEKGVPLEEVSKLLGHESIKTTEKHYSKWMKGRQDRLDSLVMGTWAIPSKGRKGPAVTPVSVQSAHPKSRAR